MATAYARGSKAWGHCQRCGFRYKLNSLIHDGQIKGLLVCHSCADPKHPQEELVSVLDPTALRNATGDMDALSSRVLPAEITLSWSLASITAVGGTAALSYTNATAPVSITFQWIGDNRGLDFSFDGSTLTLLAGTAEPGEIYAAVVATILDSDGKTATATLVVDVTISAADPSFNASYDVNIFSFAIFDMTVHVVVDPDGGIRLERGSGDGGYGIQVVLDGSLQDPWDEDFSWIRGTTIPSGEAVDGSLYRLTFAAPTVGGDIELDFVAQVGDYVVLNNDQGNHWDYSIGAGEVTLPVEVRRISDNEIVASTTLNLTFTDSSFGGY